MANQNKMAVMPMPKLVLNMALPLMFSLLVQSLYNIVDGIFVAQLSETALTATSIAYPVQMIMIAVSVGTSVGINACLSRAIGARQMDDARKITANGIFLAVISSGIFLILGCMVARRFVELYTTEERLVEMSTQYLSICMFFSGGVFLSKTFQRFLQSAGFTFDSMLSLITGAITNIILDPLLIFGIGPFPELGIRGAAIATVIAQWCGAAAAYLLYRKKVPELRGNWQGFRPDGAIIRKIYKVGFPTIITQAMGSVMVSAFNKMLMPFSDTAVAFFGVYNKLQNFLFMPMNGLGQAAIPIIAYNLGARNKERVGKVLKTTIPMAVAVAAMAMVLFQVIPEAMLGLFSPSEEMLAFGVPALKIISPTFIAASVTMVLGYAASGLGNGWINMISAIGRQFLILIPCAYLLVQLLGVQSVWYAFWIAEGLVGIYCVFAVRKEFKRKAELTM